MRGIVAERAPQQLDALLDPLVGDDAPRPDLGQQRVAVDDLRRVPRQAGQQPRGQRRQAQRAASAGQRTVAGIEDVLTDAQCIHRRGRRAAVTRHGRIVGHRRTQIKPCGRGPDAAADF